MSEPLQQSLRRSPSQLFVTESKKIREDGLIGEGHFGSVYRAHHKDWGVVAIKHLFSSSRLSEKDKNDLVSEADRMNTVKCTYIVNLFGVILEPANHSLVVEYMKYKSLGEFQKEYDNPWAMKIRMIYNVILGMNYLHTTAKMVHRDLKIDNVLVGEGFIAKVGDFGLAMWMTYTRKYTKKSKKSKKTSSQGATGTISHIAPECLSDINHEADFKCDVYGFAITLWEIITEKIPYAAALNSAHIDSCIVRGQRPDENKIPDECPEFLKKMMRDCWDNDPTKRPSFGGLKDVIEQKLENYEQEIQSAVMNLQKQEEQKINPNTMTSGQIPVHQPSEDRDVTQVTEDMARATLPSTGPQPLVGPQSGQHARGQDEGDSLGQDIATDSGPESVNQKSQMSSGKSFRQPHQETETPSQCQVDAASGDNVAKGVSQGRDPDLTASGTSTTSHQADLTASGTSTTSHQAGKHGDTTTITIGSGCSGVQIGDGNFMHVGAGAGAMGMAHLPTSGLQPQRTKQKPRYKTSTSTTVVTEDDLEDLSPHIGDDFRRLGRKLGFSNGELDGFIHDYGSSRLSEANYQMLSKWKQRKGKEATRGKLATHLCDLKMYDIAEKLP